MNLTYRLFVFDIDGTLIDKERKITEVNRQMIHFYRKLGGQVTLATGRSYPEAKRFIEHLRLQLPVILCNGAVQYDPLQDQLQTIHRISRHTALELVNWLCAYVPETDVLVYTTDTLYTIGTKPFTEQLLDREELTIVKVDRFSSIAQEKDIVKIVIATPQSVAVAFPNGLKFPQMDAVSFVQSADQYLEIIPSQTSKGQALKALAKQLNIPLKQVAVIGDHLNDLSMFKVAGLAAAVANGHPAAKKEAAVIMPSNEENAVAHFVWTYGIKPAIPHPAKAAL